MKFIDLAEPIQVSTQQVLEIFKGITEGYSRPADAGVVYLPTRKVLWEKVKVNELATAWESPFQGLRIGNFQGTGLRFLKRTGGAVTWSRPMKAGDTELMLDQFVEQVQSLIYFLDLKFKRPAGVEFIYSLDTCAQLLKASFLNEIKPRLIPKVKWPEKSDCLAALKSMIPTLPWRQESNSGTIELQKVGSDFVFQITDERGKPEVSIQSKNEDEIRWTVFSHFMRKEYFDTDSNFTFEEIYFPSSGS